MRIQNYLIASVSAMCVLGCIQCVSAHTHEQLLERAEQSNKHVYLYFYDGKTGQNHAMEQVFDQAKRDIAKHGDFYKVDTRQREGRKLAKTFGIERAPLPLVMVLAPNGAVTATLALTFTGAQLEDALSSPGMAASLKALQERKLVIVTTGEDTKHSGVAAFVADPRFTKRTQVVAIEPKDSSEQRFISSLGIEISSTAPTTALLMPPGNVVAVYHGATSKETIVSDLTRAATPCCSGGECCPGGRCH